MLNSDEFPFIKAALELRGCRELPAADRKNEYFLQIEETQPPRIHRHFFSCRDIRHMKDVVGYLLNETAAYSVTTYVPGKNPLSWTGRVNEYEWEHYYGRLEPSLEEILGTANARLQKIGENPVYSGKKAEKEPERCRNAERREKERKDMYEILIFEDGKCERNVYLNKSLATHRIETDDPDGLMSAWEQELKAREGVTYSVWSDDECIIGGALDPWDIGIIADYLKVVRAEKCLIDNGIDPSEASTVLQALGYILMDEDLYSDRIVQREKAPLTLDKKHDKTR